MSYLCVQDPSGKFLCTFDQVSLNCSTDSQCPGNGGFCYKSPSSTWSAVSSQCACYTTFAYSGLDCSGPSGPGAGALYFIIIVQILLSVMVLVLCTITGYRLAVWRFKLSNTHHVSVILLTISGIFGLAMGINHIVRFSGALPFEITPTGSKRVPNDYGGNFIFAIWFSSVCFSVLNVSVAWLFIAQMVQRNNRSMANRYRRILLGYIVLFSIALIVVIALNKTTIILYMCLPAIIYFAVVYMYGSFRIQVILKNSIAFSDKMKRKSDDLKRVSKEITITARVVSCASIVLIILVFIAGFSGYQDTPAFPTNHFLLRISYTLGNFLVLCVAVFTFRFSNLGGEHNTNTVTSEGDGKGTSKEGNKVVAIVTSKE